jgi:hypothetical protein
MPDQGPRLRDVHVPHVSAWWPLAPGWWVLAALLLIVAAVLILAWRRRAAWHRYVDGTLQELRDASRRHAQDGDAAAFATTVSQLIRRVARTRDPRSVTLRGAAWRDALASMAPRQDVTRIAELDVALYRPAVSLDASVVARDAEAWVRQAMRRDAQRPHAGRAKTHVGA